MPRLGLALLALALGGFAIGTSEFVAMGVLPEMAEGVGVSIPTAGHVISAYALGVVVGAPVLAGLGAKLPRRKLLVGLMGFYALGNLLSALAPSFETLVAGRFIAGLPHGAYFGVASLAAADMVSPDRRGTAMSRVILGLTVANVVGVPAATFLGQTLGWRAAFVLPAVIAGLTAVLVLRVLPWTAADTGATLRRELGALRRPQVLLAVATGSIGGGGMFAIYTYISPILTDRAGVDVSLVPVALAVWGCGMVAGNLIAGPLMDRAPRRGMLAVFAAMVAMFALFHFTSTHPVAAIVSLFFIGITLVLPMGLQVRLADVSEDAQTLGAALNHSAFNLANALGAWVGGLVLAAGLGLGAPMWVAAGLALAGMAIFGVSLVLERRDAAAAVPATA